jgi:hypothetical protein
MALRVLLDQVNLHSLQVQVVLQVLQELLELQVTQAKAI